MIFGYGISRNGIKVSLKEDSYKEETVTSLKNNWYTSLFARKKTETKIFITFLFHTVVFHIIVILHSNTRRTVDCFTAWDMINCDST